jgi:hypothetical protein
VRLRRDVFGEFSTETGIVSVSPASVSIVLTDLGSVELEEPVDP